jgi:hypothetical protein
MIAPLRDALLAARPRGPLKAFGDFFGELLSEKAVDEAQAHVDPGRDSGRSDDISIADEAFLNDGDVIKLCQFLISRPVGGRPLSLEEPCCGEDQRPRAYG